MGDEGNLRSPREFLPIKLRLLFVPVSVAIGYMYVFITGLFFTVSLPDIFASIEFYSIIFLALILFNLRYREGRWLSVASTVLLIWMVAVWFLAPAIARPVLLANAQQEVPTYPDLELIETQYTEPRGDREAAVSFIYRTRDPESDFEAVKNFYVNNLTEEKWPPSKHQVSDLSATHYKNIIFWPIRDVAGNHFHTGLFEGKGIELLPRVSVTYESGTPDVIRVSALY